MQACRPLEGPHYGLGPSDRLLVEVPTSLGHSACEGNGSESILITESQSAFELRILSTEIFSQSSMLLFLHITYLVIYDGLPK